MFDLTIAERVQNGIKALDSKFPNGWAESIDLDKLDMNSCTKCILGQLFRNFYNPDSCEVWGDNFKNACELGFYCDSLATAENYDYATYNHFVKKDSESLVMEWTKQINLILGK